jgi:hypothetical protein
VCGVACVKEDSGDKESGEDEEDIDPGPAPVKVSRAPVEEVVLKKDENCGTCAQAVDRRVVELVLGQRKCGRCFVG